MKYWRLLTGIFLIAGTSIGGGMLGLPLATAAAGFYYAVWLFVVCWGVMTATALMTLELNLAFPPGTHMFTMVRKTLGKPGVIVCWTIYLFFLYALVSAYIAGGQDLLSNLFSWMHHPLPLTTCAILFVCVLGLIVLFGIALVNRFNALLMLIKLSLLGSLMWVLGHHGATHPLYHGHWHALLPATSVAITSFGFSIIVPSLRSLLGENPKLLKRTIVLGSLLPLVCYILWEYLIFRKVGFSGIQGLGAIAEQNLPLSGLLLALKGQASGYNINLVSHLFMGFCILTAFLCVSLALSDYLADGMPALTHLPLNKLWLAVVTFLPPTLIVLYQPKAFLTMLSWAGVLCILLQALMPAWMVWRARYQQKLPLTAYQFWGGKIVLLFIGLLATALAGMVLVVTLLKHLP